MRASLAQLEAFYWIVELGSFHAASRHLHLTQPTISARIAELEATLKLQLFKRVRQRAQLTEQGREIYATTERMLKLSDEIARHGARANPLEGLLRLGTVESFGMHVLPALLPRLVSRFPALEIELTVDVGSALSQKINARELDVAILTDPAVDDAFVSEVLGQIELRWMCAGKFPLPRRAVTPIDLRAVPILVNPKGSTVFRIMTQWFQHAGIEPERVSTCNSFALMARLVAGGYGVAIMPPAMSQPELKAGRLRVLLSRPPVPKRPLHLVHGKSREALRPFVRLVSEAVQTSGLLTQR